MHPIILKPNLDEPIALFQPVINDVISDLGLHTIRAKEACSVKEIGIDEVTAGQFREGLGAGDGASITPKMLGQNPVLRFSGSIVGRCPPCGKGDRRKCRANTLFPIDFVGNGAALVIGKDSKIPQGRQGGVPCEADEEKLPAPNDLHLRRNANARMNSVPGEKGLGRRERENARLGAGLKEQEAAQRQNKANEHGAIMSPPSAQMGASPSGADRGKEGYFAGLLGAGSDSRG